MSSQTILYIDGDSFRVVQVKTVKGRLVVDNMRCVDADSLDLCLHEIKADSVTVCANLDSMRQHMVYVPVTKERYLRALVEGQLQGNLNETGEHSFFFSTLGETKNDGKKWLELAVFVVDDSELNGLISRFSRPDCPVTRIYPTVCALERLAALSLKDDPDRDKSIFCVADLGQTKTLFVLHKGLLCFSREVPSPGFGINEQDVQNINMTISYCSQNLHIVSVRALIISIPYDTDTPGTGITLPTQWISLPEQFQHTYEDIKDYLAPLSVALPCVDPLRGNLLPKWYKTLLNRSKSLKVMIPLVAAMLCILVGYIAVKAVEVNSLSTRMQVVKHEIKEMERLMPVFKERKQELEAFAPLLAYANAQLDRPDLHKVLVMLAVLGRPEYGKSLPGEIKFAGIPGAGSGKGALSVSITGRLAVGTFTEMNNTYQTALEAVRNFQGAEITASSMNLSGSTFDCTVQFKDK